MKITKENYRYSNYLHGLEKRIIDSLLLLLQNVYTVAQRNSDMMDGLIIWLIQTGDP